jgi:hypothetical protein
VSERATELDFVLCCGRPRLTEDIAARARQAITGPTDWSLIARLSIAHGVLPLVTRHLPLFDGLVPEAGQTMLIREQQVASVRALALTEELGRIVDRLQQAGIAVIAYKGPVLAAQLYGDVTARMFGDLDLIVRPSDFRKARVVLCSIGYQPEHLDAERTPLELLQLSECDQSFVHPPTGARVELHWAVAPPYFQLPLDVEVLFDRRILVEAGGKEVWTVGPRDALLLTCLNGTKDGWGRLETLTAFAELCRVQGGDWSDVLTDVASLHGRRMLNTAFLLARNLMQTRLPEPLIQAAERDPAAMRLSRETEMRLSSRDDASRGTLSRTVFMARCRERPSDQLRFWVKRSLVPSRRDISWIQLPRSLWPLYYVLRPARLLADRLRPDA